jgi:hypothetical protein
VEPPALDRPAVSAHAVGKLEATDGRVEEGDLASLDHEVPVGESHGHPVVMLRDDEVRSASGGLLVARLLWISPGTVRKHLENAYDKLGVHTRTGAVAALVALDAQTP